MPTPVLSIEKLTKIYHSLNGETLAIKDFTLDIGEGEFIVIVGPSGCGKTTVLSILAGLLFPSSGLIKYSNDEVTLGYMLQDDHLFPWRTILDNVYLGLEIQNRATTENKRRAELLIETYGLGKFKQHYPAQLSGGMRQRAALIRTLAINPEILLLDEPFSALDYQTRMAVTDDIGSIIKKEKKTAIMVTHDLTEAISLANRIIVLTKRPAVIKQIFDIKLTSTDHSPTQNRNAPEFMNYYNEIWKELDVHV
ncbi:ATP-binding cassette domain-containing protein [Alkalibaculum sp. M08DMB]|uniref:ATP-binding cassette domain-containing protein n=1 Tax=Alkalibaculum sporogenes TaxID=2655001 RepID=A0A6A7K5Q7_9FIRM|nr:ABC transporter ATP-binding protein [Alkalibaculum sporogenes]MPW24684.1 ATP-binding cassette domain-containing protein [Alkalibaculum sporogenes]